MHKYLLLLFVAMGLATTASANDEYFGLVKAPAESYIIEAGTNGRIFTGGWGTGFMFSINNAADFNSPTTGDPGKFITDISVNGTEILVTSLDQGVSISTNNGDSFTNIKGDLADSIEVNTGIKNGNRIIIGSRGFGFFYSDNDGTNWTQVYENIKYWDISDIEVATGDSLVAGSYGGGFFRSADNGENWEEANAVSNGVASKYVNDLYRDEGSAGYSIYAAVNGDGVYFTLNGGFNWTKMDTLGLGKKEVHASGVAVMIINSDRFPIASFKDNGIYYYDYFFEQKWTSKAKLTEGFMDVTIAEDGQIYAITAQNGIYRSEDNGEYWFPQNKNEFQIESTIEPSLNGDYYFLDLDANSVKEYKNYGSEINDLPAPPADLQDIIYHKNKVYGVGHISAYVLENNAWRTLFVDTDLVGDGDSVKVIDAFHITPNDRLVGIYRTIIGDPMAEPADARTYVFDYNLVTDVFTADEYRFDDTDLAVIRKWGITSDNSSDVMIAALPLGNFYRVNGSGVWTKKTNPEFNANRIKTYKIHDMDFDFGTYFISTNHGLFTSLDEGDTWSLNKLGFPPYVKDVQEEMPEVFQFEAVSANSWIIGLDRFYGVWYTSNKGQTWDVRNNSIVTGDAQAIEKSEDGDIYYLNNFLYLRPNPANLDAPVAITPENGAVGIDIKDHINIEWTQTVAPLYELQVASNETFTALQEEYVLAPTSLVADIPGLEFNQTYFWRVRAKYYGSFSVFNTNTFTTKLAPPVLIGPENMNTGIELDGLLSWEQTDGADTYYVQIAKDSSFATIVADLQGITELSVPSENLENNTTYFWRAKAENEAGNYSDWSMFFSFSTILAAPELVSPTDMSTKVSINPRYTWAAATGAETYMLEVSTTESFDDGTVFSELGDIVNLEAQLDPLEYQTVYYWRVAAVDSNENQSQYSDVWEFTTGLPAVQLISPANNALNTEFTLQFVWESLEIADEYDFELSANANMTNPILEEAGTQLLTIEATNLQDYTEYYWRVRGNANGEKGTWSEVYKFRTKMLSLELLTPADESVISDTKTTLTWNNPKGVTQFDLVVALNSDLTDPTVERESFTGNSFDLLGLTEKTDYYWQVRGYNDDRTSSTGFSPIWTFFVEDKGSVFEEDNLVSLSPNPANGQFNLNVGDGNYDSYIILDATGASVVADNITAKTTVISTIGMSAGQYFVILKSGNTMTYKTLIIE